MESGPLRTMAINTTGNEVQSPTLITPLSPEGNETHFSNNLQPPSFEAILSGTSLSPYSRVAFSNFLKKVHCSENLDFLLSSNQYLIRCAEKNNDFDYESQQLWFFIYTNYISSDSLKEVNIPHDLKEELTNHFVNDTLPDTKLIERTMISIKDLLRDGYVQFIQSVKKAQHHYFDKINENYSLLPPSPAEDYQSPQPKSFQQSVHLHSVKNRRLSDDCSPLDAAINDPARCVSPLSDSELGAQRLPARPITNEIPRSVDSPFDYAERSDSPESDFTAGTDSKNTNGSISSSSSKTKSSISEASGLKKFAGKFRWRRLSSNSSTSSSN